MNSAKIAEIDAGLKLIVGESVLREYPQSKNFSWRHMEFLDTIPFRTPVSSDTKLKASSPKVGTKAATSAVPT